MECLICEEKMAEKMTDDMLKCKMCGMVLNDESHRHNEHLFCSEKCVRIFKNVLNIYGTDSKIATRKIVL